jgi:glycosyltransferase involved in cell wall biosynthesis
VSEARESHHLVFVGPDTYGFQSCVQSAVIELGLQKQVFFHGPAYGNEKWSLLDNAACLCLPSIAEGLPLVLCEALGAGIPSIYSFGCNFPEIEKSGAGICIYGFDVNEWANTIDSVCLDSQVSTSMRMKSRRLSEKYRAENVVDQWCEVYERIRK